MSDPTLDARIADWRGYVTKSRAIDTADADELEEHLRDRIDELESAGLDDDEAFLIAVKRLGSVDALSREYARANSAKLWKQLLPTAPARSSREVPIMIGFAVLAAALVRAMFEPTVIAARDPSAQHAAWVWFGHNVGIVVLGVLAVWLLLRRHASWKVWTAVAIPFAVAAVAVNVFPFAPDDATGVLTATHLLIVLWLAIGIAYVNGDWRTSSRRMDFIRFTGEFAIYYVLIALGGGVLFTLASLILQPLVPEAPDALMRWVLYPGAAGGVIVAAWLVEAKQSVIENLAPVLTAIFTPLFALLAVASLVSYLALGLGVDFNRDLITVFDALLVVVLGLVLYGLSARDPRKPAGIQDVLALVTVVAALVLDALVLWSLIARIGELGWTPNRVAALGLNVVLVVVLTGAAWLGARFLAHRAPMATLERWQTGYLPVYGAWAAVVALVLPPIFGFA